jgi:hypothetical protein
LKKKRKGEPKLITLERWKTHRELQEMRASDHLEVQEANANDSYDSSSQNDDSLASAFANESQQNEVLGMDSVGEEPEQELPTAPMDISPDLANLPPPTSTDAAANRDERDLTKYFPYNIHQNLYRKPASMREPLERPTFFRWPCTSCPWHSRRHGTYRFER